MTVSRLMIGVAVIAILLAGGIGLYRFAEDIRYATLQNGWNTSVLPVGLAVVVVEKCRWRDDEVFPGEAGVVTADPPDDDSAYPERLISVRMDTGPHRGTTVPVRRICLRAR